MTGNALMDLDHISCRYAIRQGRLGFKYYEALRDVSVTIHDSEILGVIGRNGAGKSTLLKLIAGIILPDSGKIVFHKPTTVSLLTLQLGFSSELSGRYNAIMGAMFLGYTKKQAVGRVDPIIRFAELEDWIDEPLKTYSSGMRARLGFAVAMEMRPGVLLIDEVFGVGDESFREKSVRALKEKMNQGQATVFVSHSDYLLKSVCSRMLWIEAGSVRQVGEVGEVLRAYQEDTKSKPRMPRVGF